VALANAELRFPLIRRFELGILPIGLPPLDGLVFYDAGIAWSTGQKVQSRVPANPDETSLNTRYPLTSYGVGLRLNLFNYAIVRWDYAIPLDQPGREGFWTWSLGPSF
jgi:outer membrane protein assembly factor BamA